MTQTAVTSVERLTAFRATDLDDLCEATEAAVLAGGGFGWVKAPRRHLLESYWKGVLLVPERQLFVGRLEGIIAGSAQLVRPARNNEAQAHQAHVTTSFVAPWARGRGLAKLLTLAIEQAARSAGAAVINLDLRETHTAAIALYEGLGYVRWGEQPAYARIEGRLLRGFHYYKLIEPSPEGAAASAASTPGGDGA